MQSRSAQVIPHFSTMPRWGKDQRTNVPFTWSNLQISKSVPGLKKIFSQGIVIDASKIFRSNDRDEVEIPVVLGHNGSARNFTINLRPIAENQCHIKIKEQIPNQASKTILEDAGIIHKDNEPRIQGQDNFFTSHLRREIQYLTGGRSTQEPASTPARNLAIEIAKPNNSIQTGGLTIEGSNEKVLQFLSKPDIQVENKKPNKTKLEKLIRLIDPSAPVRESTLKFKLTNPNGKDQAKLTVSDRSGDVLLKDSIIKIERSTSHQDRNPAVKALYKAVGKLNNQYNASTAA